MDNSIPTAVGQCIKALVADRDVCRVTKFLSDSLVVTASAQVFTGAKGKRRNRGHESFVVTIGKPNYAQRQFIKKCKKAGEPLPVKKVQLKLIPGVK